jgi:hypothetical protein
MSRSRLLAVLLTLAVAPAVVLTAQQSVSPPTPSVEPPQMIVLLVDLRTPPGDERQAAVMAAERTINNLRRRSDVGLDRPPLFALKTLGARVETVQDFTWNSDLIHAALGMVARQPPPANQPADRSSSVAAMCSELAQMSPTSAHRAVYYYDHLSRTAEAVQRVLDLAGACRRPNVDFRIGVSFDLPVPPPPVGVSVRLVPHQAGSPVSIVESMSPLDDGYASVLVRDDVDKAIRSVTLAALVRPSDPAMTTPQVFIRRGPSVALLPRATAAIAVQLMDQSTLDAFSRKGADIELGVVAVEFADGSTWTYDLAAKRRFERH